MRDSPVAPSPPPVPKQKYDGKESKEKTAKRNPILEEITVRQKPNTHKRGTATRRRDNLQPKEPTVPIFRHVSSSIKVSGISLTKRRWCQKTTMLFSPLDAMALVLESLVSTQRGVKSLQSLVLAPAHRLRAEALLNPQNGLLNLQVICKIGKTAMLWSG